VSRLGENRLVFANGDNAALAQEYLRPACCRSDAEAIPVVVTYASTQLLAVGEDHGDRRPRFDERFEIGSLRAGAFRLLEINRRRNVGRPCLRMRPVVVAPLLEVLHMQPSLDTRDANPRYPVMIAEIHGTELEEKRP
jgi:hypothetical protein